MSEAWDYQIRVNLEDRHAETARHDPNDPSLEPLPEILRRHDATLICQFDAFAGYVAEAEGCGVESYPLYAWTKATIENPAKKAKYTKSFSLRVGGAEVYEQTLAEALEAELAPLVGGGIITRLSKHDTNPANNPQPPAKYRQS